MAKRKKAWSKTVEHMGQRVRLYERGSVIYREVRVEPRPGLKSGRDRVPIRRDGSRVEAEQDAIALCEHLADLSLNPEKQPDGLTLGRLRRLYLDARGDSLSRARRTFVETSLGMFEKLLGEGFPMVDYSKNTTADYTRARMDGTLRPDSKRARERATAGTVRNELSALATVCRWATGERRGGRPLLASNPVHSKDGPKYSKEERARPRTGEERYGKLLAVADKVDPTGRFRVLLILAWATGRRINAICHLRASDFLATPDAINAALAEAGEEVEVELADGSKARVGALWKVAIRWRAEWDKVGRQTFAPVSSEVAETVGAYMRASGRIGDAFLFPGSDGETPIDKQMAGYYLRRAEKLADLPHVRRGGWHAFRRAWAHRNKHKSPHDVAAVGGWFDLGALQDAYQSKDPASMLSVVNGD
jgi:integrase